MLSLGLYDIFSDLDTSLWSRSLLWDLALARLGTMFNNMRPRTRKTSALWYLLAKHTRWYSSAQLQSGT